MVDEKMNKRKDREESQEIERRRYRSVSSDGDEVLGSSSSSDEDSSSSDEDSSSSQEFSKSLAGSSP